MLDELTILDWSLAGTLFLLFCLQVYWYARYLAAPARQMRKQSKVVEQPDDKKQLPPVTVVLCAHNESFNLSHYLQALLTQDYPTYEVIVVNDGSQDSTREVIEAYMNRDSRLRTTFVPADARVRSTKKVALTLAAKSAKYDYLLLTDADCVPESDQWIREMMKGFKSEEANIDIVLGFGAYFYQRDFINRVVRYETLFNGLHYLGAALCHHPYMGVGRNLAYRKRFFFESGGFTRLMDSRAGDDDLFVNHVATGSNTGVVLSRESFTWSLTKTTLKDWLQQKRRHLSVSPMYRTATKWRLMFEPLTRGLFYALFLTVIICHCLPELDGQFAALSLPLSDSTFQLPLLLTVAVALFLMRWIMQTAILNISARRMALHRFSMLSILWFDLTLPLVNLWMLIVPSRNANKW